jgi:DNA segregation ATPase FtsK/SpoIIIE-like protein
VFLYLIGYLAYLFPVMVGYSGWLVFRGRSADGDIDYRTLGVRWLGFLLTVGSGCALAALHFSIDQGTLPLASAGGILGEKLAGGFSGSFNTVGATLFLLALFLAGVTLFTGLSWLGVMDRLGRWTLQFMVWVRERTLWVREYLASRKVRLEREEGGPRGAEEGREPPAAAYRAGHQEGRGQPARREGTPGPAVRSAGGFRTAAAGAARRTAASARAGIRSRHWRPCRGWWR